MKRYIPKKPPDLFARPTGLRQIHKRLRPPRRFTLRRRGVKRIRVGEDELEKRAVSEEAAGGVATLPERIVYRELLRRRVTFDFQSSLLGGRLRLGGMVADFI